MVKYGACTQERSSLEKDMVQGAAFAVAIGCIVCTICQSVFSENPSFALVIPCEAGHLVGMSLVYRDASPCESLEF